MRINVKAHNRRSKLGKVSSIRKYVRNSRKARPIYIDDKSTSQFFFFQGKRVQMISHQNDPRMFRVVILSPTDEILADASISLFKDYPVKGKNWNIGDIRSYKTREGNSKILMNFMFKHFKNYPITLFASTEGSSFANEKGSYLKVVNYYKRLGFKIVHKSEGTYAGKFISSVVMKRNPN